MKIALINPPYYESYYEHWANNLPLGLGYIASSLLANNHDVIICDGKLNNYTLDDTINNVISNNPHLIGITCMTSDFPITVELSKKIKLQKDIPIVIGGAHCNALREDALEECSSVDFGCIGEGEDFFIELIEYFNGTRPIENIKGLIYRKKGGVLLNTERHLIKNLDSLQFPAWNLFPSIATIPIITHRGCPFNCILCSHNSGKRSRNRSIENVLSELDYISHHFNPTAIRFEDETFGLDLNRSKAILKGIIQKGLNDKIKFSAQTRVDRMDREFAELLKKANFFILEMGVESGSDEVLKRIGKGININQVFSAVSLAKNSGLKIWCKFILGHPYETLDEMRETVKIISKLNPDRLSVAIMTPYPGTEIYKLAKEGKANYKLISSNWKEFDKYFGSALEFENISLTKLKLLQIWCYLRLYLSNLRILDLVKLLYHQRKMVYNIIKSNIKRLIKTKRAILNE